MRLTDLFMELIAYVAYFNRSVATRQPAFDQVKADIDRLMSDIESRLERTQIAPDEFDLARFAVVACNTGRRGRKSPCNVCAIRPPMPANYFSIV